MGLREACGLGMGMGLDRDIDLGIEMDWGSRWVWGLEMGLGGRLVGEGDGFGGRWVG